MISAGMTFAVFVIVMITGRVLILNKCLCKESLYRFIGTAHISSVEGDASLLHSHLCASADTSADQNVSLCILQKSCKCAVSCAHCSNYLLIDDLAVSNVIELELLCSAEMLKDLSVFIGNCDFHGVISFLCRVGLRCSTAPCRASAFAVPMLLPAANAVVAAGDAKGLCIHKACCDFAPCTFINFLYGRTRNIHLCSALLVGLPLKID